MLAMGCALPWAARCLTVPQVSAAIGATLAALYGLRYWLKNTSRSYPYPSVRTKPLLLLFRGRFLPKALRTGCLSEDDIRRRLRCHGIYCTADLYVLVLEPGGLLSWVRLSPLPAAPERSGLMHWHSN